MDQKEITVDQKIDSIKLGESVDSSADQEVISALFTIAEAQKAVDEIGNCIGQLIKLHSARIEGRMEANNCQKMEAMLWEERREHQEQLRTITQDVNQLEMVLRPIRQQEYAQKKAELASRTTILEAKLDELENNNTFGEIGGQLVTKNEAENSNEQIAVPNPGHIQFQLFLAFLQQLQQKQQQMAQLPSNWQQNFHQIARGGNGLSNKPVGTPDAPIFPTRFPPSISSMLPNPHQPKMKACQHCQRSIHRNAPQCPFCKQKIISKAAKRARR